tara:strand:- start:4907 stop:5398 length:492 start_codon:yes stop_codon:yes gene_type:complete
MKTNTQPSYMQILGQLNLEDIYIQQTFDYYRECYEDSEQYQLFVQNSPRIPDELRDHSYVGICDRTLGTQIPKARTLTGGAMRGNLQTAGLITATGNELFRGCAVFPEYNDKGDIIAAVGYRFGDRIRHWQQEIIHWEKPENDGYVQDGLLFVKETIYGKACH